jgi:hypothetical protein
VVVVVVSGPADVVFARDSVVDAVDFVGIADCMDSVFVAPLISPNCNESSLSAPLH